MQAPEQVMTVAKEFLERWDQEEQKVLKLALFGQPGSGKSSLINALVGRRLAEVSNVTDTTKEAQVVEHQGVVYVDLPGYDTSVFPANAYFQTFNPLQYDLFLCVFSGKLRDADTTFFRLLQQSGRSCIFVRNKADGIYDETKTLAESRQEIVADVCHQVGETCQVVFTSCREDRSATQRGIPELEAAITQQLDPALQGKFLRSMKAYTSSVLEQKRELCQRHIKQAMVGGALNGLNPILGVDATIDSEILRRLYKHVREVFDIGEEELQTNKIKSKVVDLILRGVKKEAIMKMLGKLMTESMEKRMSKYIPYVGQGVSMSLGAGTMYYLGNEYVDACYEYARLRLEYEIGRQN